MMTSKFQKQNEIVCTLWKLFNDLYERASSSLTLLTTDAGNGLQPCGEFSYIGPHHEQKERQNHLTTHQS
ncbi:hypothetical protein DPMN_164838 [Dreissena polymorpha]|uniref:Uncharacterized protein n=1 Tax=Dreissena polymorpha TaxID=45954 RepID=A0A9D4ETN7_DREPO|nr:hypothetical protein DPMN_164838 [Dreissena polymorpha]